MSTLSSTCSHRVGPVRNRSQFFHARLQRWVKRDANTGRFLEVKRDARKFKGVRREA